MDGSLPRAGLQGVLVLNKPRGMISKDVSRRLQRYLGKKLKLGHVGTLDPMAEGVLPLLLGSATRLQDELVARPKTYRFTIAFGYETDTLDAEGQVIKQGPLPSATYAEAAALVGAMPGVHLQRPPLYSAVKFRGRPLYDYARSGQADLIAWEALSRSIEIYTSSLLAYDGKEMTLEVRCSKGTYVRVLAQELAAKLASCGTVIFLQRRESAGVSLEHAHDLARVEALLAAGHDLAAPYLLPLEELDLGPAQLMIEEEEVSRRLRMGQILRFSPGTFLYDRICVHLNNNARSSECSLILREDAGRVFGLGIATRLAGDSVQVVMKRSLV